MNDFGINIYLSTINFWLFVYLTDTVGLPPSLAGMAVVIGRVSEVLAIPVIGYCSDRFTTRWGRLRPYLLIGAVPSFITMALLFGVPAFDSRHALFVWVTLAFSLASIVNSTIGIPYSAMTTIITKDYHELTSLNAWRMIFAISGTLMATLGGKFIIDIGDSTREGFVILGTESGIIMMVTALITFGVVKEPEHAHSQAANRHPFRDLLVPFHNKAFLSLLIAYVSYLTGLTLVSGALVYYCKYVFRDANMVPLAFGALIISTIFFVPAWVPVSKKIGKKLSLTIGMLNLSLVTMLFFLLGHHLPRYAVLLLIAFGGIGLSAGHVFPWAMLPDTATLHLADTGDRRDGLYYSTWTFMGKVGQFAAALFIGLILSLTGYLHSTSGNLDQPDSAIFGIRLLAGLIPSLFYLASAISIRFYPLTEAKYTEMLERTRQSLNTK